MPIAPEIRRRSAEHWCVFLEPGTRLEIIDEVGRQFPRHQPGHVSQPTESTFVIHDGDRDWLAGVWVFADQDSVTILNRYRRSGLPNRDVKHISCWIVLNRETVYFFRHNNTPTGSSVERYAVFKKPRPAPLRYATTTTGKIALPESTLKSFARNSRSALVSPWCTLIGRSIADLTSFSHPAISGWRL